MSPDPDFRLQHLGADQARGLYDEALRQAEAGLLGIRVNLLLNPHDAGLKATYDERQERIDALRTERDRLCTAPDPT